MSSVSDRIEQRRAQWAELEVLCSQLELRRSATGSASQTDRFAKLYRDACADLALASAYQLPPNRQQYLHRLVARAHNQLYRAQRWQPGYWMEVVFVNAPQQIYRDPCVRVAALVFYGLFIISMLLAWQSNLFPGFAEALLGQDALDSMREMYSDDQSEARGGSFFAARSGMAGFYIQHNTTIGLQCFAYGILIIPSLLLLGDNAIQLGAVFGYMARDSGSQATNFLKFVTAHGPLELTAIALSAAAGMRIGLGWFYTQGLPRSESLRVNTMRSLPIVVAAVVLFFLAAFTEAFISPSNMPYLVKAAWGLMTSAGLTFYFVVLGFPRGGTSAA
jgi:uncharacterized membrane protein SpoIIM required for sporulation